MPEYLAPGVYIEETGFRAKSIAGVATSTGGFLSSLRIVAIGIAIGVAASVALDRARRRRRPDPDS